MILRRERERIGRRSRSDLLDELRRKNEELERYNTQLEHLVEERTAELREANRKMRSDLDAGTEYVRSLLPQPCNEPVRIDWRYVPSSNLGGGTFSAITGSTPIISQCISSTSPGTDSTRLCSR